MFFTVHLTDYLFIVDVKLHLMMNVLNYYTKKMSMGKTIRKNGQKRNLQQRLIYLSTMIPKRFIFAERLLRLLIGQWERTGSAWGPRWCHQITIKDLPSWSKNKHSKWKLADIGIFNLDSTPPQNHFFSPTNAFRSPSMLSILHSQTLSQYFI